MRYWLMKSEPSVYGIDDLERDGSTGWEGVRNYQARNFMRDDMQVGDLALFYHSNANPPGVAGTMRVIRAAYPDETALNPESPYFDPRHAQKGHTDWVRVDLVFEQRFAHLIPLECLRADKHLQDLMVIRKGCRLSVQPVSGEHFARICALGQALRGA